MAQQIDRWTCALTLQFLFLLCAPSHCRQMDQLFILLNRTKDLEEIINFGVFPFASEI